MENSSPKVAPVTGVSSVEIPHDGNDKLARFRHLAHGSGCSTYYLPSEREAIRHRCHLSQKGVANLLECSERTVSRWENGADLTEAQQLLLSVLDHLGPEGFVTLKEAAPGTKMVLWVDRPLTPGDADKLYEAAKASPGAQSADLQIDTRTVAEREEAIQASDPPSFCSDGDVAKLMAFRKITVKDLARYVGTKTQTIRKWRDNSSHPGKVSVIVLKLLWSLGPTDFCRRLGISQ